LAARQNIRVQSEPATRAWLVDFNRFFYEAHLMPKTKHSSATSLKPRVNRGKKHSKPRLKKGRSAAAKKRSPKRRAKQY